MGRNPNYSSALLKANKIVSMDVIRLAPQPRLSRPSPAFHLHPPIPPIPPNPFILAPYKANSHPPPPYALRPYSAVLAGVPHLECALTPAPAHTLHLPGTPENLPTPTLSCAPPTPKFVSLHRTRSEVLILVGEFRHYCLLQYERGRYRERSVEQKAFGPKDLNIP